MAVEVIPSAYTRTIAPAPKRSPSWMVSWRGYFLEFNREHGGDPVHHGGLLLYRDGWRYSAIDYRGPEVKPPKAAKELLELQLAYWQRRAEVVYAARSQLYERARVLDDLRRDRSAPLQTERLVADGEGYRREASAVDWKLLSKQMERATKDLAECEVEIVKLKGALAL